MQGGKRSSVDARVDIQAPTCIFVVTHPHRNWGEFYTRSSFTFFRYTFSFDSNYLLEIRRKGVTHLNN